MKLFYFFLLVALFGATKGYRRLNQQENQQLQAVCGTKPAQLAPRTFTAPRSIYGGIPISGENAPWAVQFLGCSGTLISPRHILSASHCVMENRNSYKPFLNYAASVKCETSDLVYDTSNLQMNVLGSKNNLISQKVTKIILVNYCAQPNWLDDDIMILELGNDVVYNAYTHPACISKSHLGAINSEVFITGYGHSNLNRDDESGPIILRFGYMKIASYQKNGRQFVTEGSYRNTDARPGDSGGGAFQVANERYTILGIVSGGYIGVLSSFFTSVTHHHNQICWHTGVCIF